MRHYKDSREISPPPKIPIISSHNFADFKLFWKYETIVCLIQECFFVKIIFSVYRHNHFFSHKDVLRKVALSTILMQAVRKLTNLKSMIYIYVIFYYVLILRWNDDMNLLFGIFYITIMWHLYEMMDNMTILEIATNSQLSKCYNFCQFLLTLQMSPSLI